MNTHAVPDDGQIVGDRPHGFSRQGDTYRILLPTKGERISHPGPIVGQFSLVALGEILLEESVPIADTVSVEGNPHGGGGIQEAGRQATKSAVAQRVIGDLLKNGYIHPVFRHSVPHLIQNSQIQQIGVDQSAHQKLRREVIGALLPPHLFPGLLDLSTALPHHKFGHEIVLLRHRHTRKTCPFHLRRQPLAQIIHKGSPLV